MDKVSEGSTCSAVANKSHHIQGLLCTLEALGGQHLCDLSGANMMKHHSEGLCVPNPKKKRLRVHLMSLSRTETRAHTVSLNCCPK